MESSCVRPSLRRLRLTLVILGTFVLIEAFAPLSPSPVSWLCLRLRNRRPRRDEILPDGVEAMEKGRADKTICNLATRERQMTDEMDACPCAFICISSESEMHFDLELEN